jgi:hypothetical protein
LGLFHAQNVFGRRRKIPAHANRNWRQQQHFTRSSEILKLTPPAEALPGLAAISLCKTKKILIAKSALRREAAGCACCEGHPKFHLQLPSDYK